MKIGILEAGHVLSALSEEFGSYPEMFASFLAGYGFEFETYSVVDGIFPQSATSADGWLITGSRYGAYEDLDWIEPLEVLIRDAYARSIPIVGVCFGHQILAQALGGVVEKFDGGWSVGPTDYRLEGVENPVSVMAFHQDQVVKPPKDAKVIGSTPFCENAVLVYGNKALSIQPHPEFSDDFFAALLEKRGRGLIPQDLLDSAADKIGVPLSGDWVSDQMAAFFKQPRAHGARQ